MIGFTRLAAVAAVLCSTPHAVLIQADAVRSGGPGAVDAGARQVTVPSAVGQECPGVVPRQECAGSVPQAAPLGTELQPEELERRKRAAERLPPPQVPPGQQDQERW